MHRLLLLTFLMLTKLLIFGVDLRCYCWKILMGFVALYSYPLLLGVFCLFCWVFLGCWGFLLLELAAN